ncbi:MAG TPA: hypothetical protein VFL13_08475 [Candidatus Baltobacteraceae bacterium]|nr:hypothetical protein [Candidatus Baltobacteraceae bacterium]
MKFAARFLVLCAVACSVLAARPAPQGLGPLLDRMRAVNGGLFNAHIVSTSRHLVDNAPAILTTHVQDFRYRQDQCTGSVCLGTYFDGERLFSVNINDTALPRSQAPEARVRALRILAMLAFLQPHFDGTIYDNGSTIFMGRRVRAVIVSDPVALPLRIFVDPQTGLVTGAQDLNREETYVMRDYRRVGTFVLPFQILLNGQPLETYITRQVVSGALGTPQGLRSQTVPGVNPAVSLDPDSVSPLGTCTLGTVKVSCLIDSGNSAMSMSVELAEQLNLPPVGMLRVSGLGNYATEVVHAGPLRVGNQQFDPANYFVLSDIHKYGYDLVVGADVLASLPVTIDYKKHEMYLDPKTAIASGGTSVPLAFQNFVPVVNVRLGGEQSALAVDTGDQSNINLGYDYYKQHPELFQATKTRSVSGVGGDSVELIGEIGSVSIGSITAEHQQIGTTETLHGTADGHLGAGFLSKYRVVLDYAHQLMRLLPIPPVR